MTLFFKSFFTVEMALIILHNLYIQICMYVLMLVQYVKGLLTLNAGCATGWETSALQWIAVGPPAYASCVWKLGLYGLYTVKLTNYEYTPFHFIKIQKFWIRSLIFFHSFRAVLLSVRSGKCLSSLYLHTLNNHCIKWKWLMWEVSGRL